MPKLNIKANHKIIKQYSEILEGFTLLHTFHETAVKSAFQRVLEDCAKQFNWTLIQEYQIKRVTIKRNIRVDGAIKNDKGLVHGHWEAKDEDDNLDKEIKNKFNAGYPKDNIIFQTPSRAVLYQNGKCIFDDKLDKPQNLLDLLNLFFEYTPPFYEQWEVASLEFKDRIPEIGNALLEIIERERKINSSFIAAYQKFAEVIKNAINPNISDKAIEEMLVQHILTERIFRKIFNNPDFTSKNIIAHEIEKVVSALTSRGWNRDEFLKQLDRFYLAIEETAKSIDDFSELQGFLNTLYENFFQGFSIKVADTHGIVYTPQPIVNFMIKSVESILSTEFNKTFSDKNIHILDPFVGTGNFITNIMNGIKPSMLPHKYANELHCNEIMLLPYYIASMNIEHQYFELVGEYKPFEGICLVDTFELAEDKQLSLFSEENTERVKKQKETPIYVIIGNPPYNSSQQNEMDQNKNRQHNVVDSWIRDSYIKDSNSLGRTTRKLLYDPYIKAIKWASERINENGIIAFISNSSFVEDIAFDGVRKNLSELFNKIYILNLGGNVRRNPKLSGTTHNVFGIQVGVSISIFIKNKNTKGCKIFYSETGTDWRKEDKFKYLNKLESAKEIKWKVLNPDANHNWITEGLQEEFYDFIPIGIKKEKHDIGVKSVFNEFALGISTNKDSWLYNFNKNNLEKNCESFIEVYNSDLDKWKRLGKSKDLFSVITSDEKKIKYSSLLLDKFKRQNYVSYDNSKIRISQYRPFAKMYLYFDKTLIDAPTLQGRFFPNEKSEKENIVIWVKVGAEIGMYALVANTIPNLLTQAGSQTFPLYTYDETGSNRKYNVTSWVLNEFRNKYKNKNISEKDLFHYVYAVLNHPEYKSNYDKNLKKELPRIPFLKNFDEFVNAGRELTKIHLNYEKEKEFKLHRIESKGIKINYRVECMKLSKDKKSIFYNDFLTLTGIPEDTFKYKLGNRSALDWVIDQYQVSIDKRSGIVNDPNRLDEPEYIVNLIGRIITVSLRTVEIINEFPEFKII